MKKTERRMLRMKNANKIGKSYQSFQHPFFFFLFF